MPVKPSEIWPDSPDFPSQSEIMRYVDGKMNRDEQRNFEKQMDGSELLTDVVEGLLLEHDQNPKVIDELNAWIDNKTEGQGKVVSIFSYRNMAVAASVLVIFVAGALFFLLKESVTAPDDAQVAVSSQAPTDSLQIQISAGDDNHQVLSSNNKPENVIAYSPIKEEEKNRPVSKSTDDEDQTYALSAPASIAEQEPYMEIESSEKTAFDAEPDTIISPSIIQDMLAYVPVKEVPENDSKELNEEVVSDYRKEKKSKGLKQESSFRAAGAAIPKRAYTSSDKADSKPTTWNENLVLLIKENKTEAALKELQTIIGYNDDRKETALWLTSACLLKMNRKAETKTILEQLINSNGVYKKEAERVLEGLK